MYVLNKFWQQTANIQQNIFEKTLLVGCSPHLFASFGTFCVPIVLLFAEQWVFKQSEKFRNRQHFPSMRAICRFSNILQKHSYLKYALVSFFDTLTILRKDLGKNWLFICATLQILCTCLAYLLDKQHFHGKKKVAPDL